MGKGMFISRLPWNCLYTECLWENGLVYWKSSGLNESICTDININGYSTDRVKVEYK